MIVNTQNLVPMTEANQNFSKVVRMVDEMGTAIILKNNKPTYAVMNFEEYDIIQNARREMILKTADQLIEENLVALMELAK